MFAHPRYLWFLLILLPLIAWYVWKQRNLSASLSVSTLRPLAKLPHSWKE